MKTRWGAAVTFVACQVRNEENGAMESHRRTVKGALAYIGRRSCWSPCCEDSDAAVSFPLGRMHASRGVHLPHNCLGGRRVRTLNVAISEWKLPAGEPADCGSLNSFWTQKRPSLPRSELASRRAEFSSPVPLPSPFSLRSRVR